MSTRRAKAHEHPSLRDGNAQGTPFQDMVLLFPKQELTAIGYILYTIGFLIILILIILAASLWMPLATCRGCRQAVDGVALQIALRVALRLLATAASYCLRAPLVYFRVYGMRYTVHGILYGVQYIPFTHIYCTHNCVYILYRY